jgi:hypothetical protein
VRSGTALPAKRSCPCERIQHDARIGEANIGAAIPDQADVVDAAARYLRGCFCAGDVLRDQIGDAAADRIVGSTRTACGDRNAPRGLGKGWWRSKCSS